MSEQPDAPAVPDPAVPDPGHGRAPARSRARREELAEAATDVVLDSGLLRLSLRPLAAALGTSDRMLLYHFADKDDLVAAILRISSDRSVAELRTLPPAPDIRTAVHALWRAATGGQLARCQRLYVEAAALGLLGQEPYATVVREANLRWEQALVALLVEAGCPAERAPRAAFLLDAGFMGFQLDLPLYGGTAVQQQAVDDLADAVATVAAGSSSGGG